MCGRYNLITDADALIDFFEIEQSLLEPAESTPRYNIAPNQQVPIVRSSDNRRELLLARWGLVPHWSKEANPKYSTINARAETVAEKPSYREAFRRKRCLIPATGFYEWKRENDYKTPYHIQLVNGGLFSFAGLWDHWERQGEGFDSCSIIVTAANQVMQPIHQRMPVILNQSEYKTWLNPAFDNRARLESMLLPFAGSLKAYPVSTLVNNPRNDNPDCTAPV